MGEELDKAREEEHVQSASYTWMIPSKKNNKIVKVRKFENAIYMVNPQQILSMNHITESENKAKPMSWP